MREEIFVYHTILLSEEIFAIFDLTEVHRRHTDTKMHADLNFLMLFEIQNKENW